MGPVPDRVVTAVVALATVIALAVLAGAQGRLMRDRSRLRHRLPPLPLGRRGPSARSGSAGADGSAGWRRRRVVQAGDAVATVLGRRLRAWARRRPDPVADRRLGRAAVAALAAGWLIGWPAAVLAGALVFGGPGAWARRQHRRRAAAVVDGLPELIDLVRVGVDAGLDAGTALRTAAEHVELGGVIAEALHGVHQRVERGDRLTDALVEIELLGDPARGLHGALTASLRHGVPVGPALERAADDARDTRRRRREEATRTLPVKLIFPLVFCTLPALVLLTVVPLLVRSFPSLAP
jgi:tight adherence protein C